MAARAGVLTEVVRGVTGLACDVMGRFERKKCVMIIRGRFPRVRRVTGCTTVGFGRM